MAGLRASLARRLALLARPRAAEVLPVQLDRRRVYVLPTGFGLFYAVLVLAMALGALNYNNNPALLMALLLGATAMASLIFAHLQLSGLRMDAVSADPVHAGESLMLHIALSAHDGRLRRGLRLDGVEAVAFAPAMSAEGTVVELGLPTHRRGWHDIGRLRVSTTQPLGLARAWSWIWPPPLLVYPALEVHGPPLPEGGRTGQRAKLDPAGDDVHHLRGYRPGDAPRTIAWKPSARRDMLLVREYEQPVGVEVRLDWDALGPLAHEERIRRLAHWVELGEREGRRYRLSLPGQPPLGPANGALHRHLCLRALALMPHADRPA